MDMDMDMVIGMDMKMDMEMGLDMVLDMGPIHAGG